MKYSLEPFFVYYIATWVSVCSIALILVYIRPSAFSILSVEYWQFLKQPWKLATFVVATAGMTIIAPWTGDPTWDHFDGFFMSVLTFTTAPWVVATLFRWRRGGESMMMIFVALCTMLFSTSWSYDIYLVFRDGVYPITWWANLKASVILYILAGMMWSLEWTPRHGLRFAFMASEWPKQSSTETSWRLALIILPFMIVASALILPFLWGGWN